MHNPGRSKGNRGGSKRDSRMNTNFDASELLGFRYDRSPSFSPPQRNNGRKHVHRPTLPPVTKAQFVQANFRFMLGPLTNPLEACLYDPDVIVPWKFVQCVILPQKVQVASSSLRTRSASDEPVDPATSALTEDHSNGYAEDDLYSQTCPICLDSVQIPRLTSCGHTFCYTCILRHLNSDLANYNKCPICAVSLVAADLKTVFYSHEDAAAVFSHPPELKEGRRLISPGVTELQVGQACTFQLLELTKGSLVPRLCHSNIPGGIASVEHAATSQTRTGAGLSLGQVLPECAAEGAHYSRLTCLSVDMMRQLFAHDRRILLEYRQQCLPPVPEATPVPTEKAPIAAPISAWGPPPGAAKAPPSTAQSSTTTGKVAWGDKRLSAGIVSGAGGAGSGTQAQEQRGTQTNTGGSEGYWSLYDVEMTGDVEALPYITQALERQQALESAFENNVTFDPPVPIVRQGSNTSTGGASHGAGKANYRIYQHVSGNLIFLHPICAKCILESQYGAGNAVTPGPRGGQTSSGTDSSEASVSSTVSATAEATTTTSTTIITAHTTKVTSADQDQHALVTGTIVEIERVRVTEDSRQRYNVVRHLPLHSEALLVEIDVAPLVAPHVLCKYSDELGKRALRRKERAKQEKRERRLEHDKAVAEALLAQERHDYQRKLRDMELAQLEDLMRGPALSVQAGYSGEGAGSEADHHRGRLGSGSSEELGARVNGGIRGGETFSFSTITQMGGNFPTLGAANSSDSKHGNKARTSGGGGAWGTSKAAPSKGSAASSTSRPAEPKAAVPSASAPAVLGNLGEVPVTKTGGGGESGTMVFDAATVAAPAAGGASGSKKPKKTKIVLMSNAGLRGAR